MLDHFLSHAVNRGGGSLLLLYRGMKEHSSSDLGEARKREVPAGSLGKMHSLYLVLEYRKTRILPVSQTKHLGF